MKPGFGHFLGVLAVLGTVTYVVHRIKRQRREINKTIQILGPKDKFFYHSLLALKPERKLRHA